MKNRAGKSPAVVPAAVREAVLRELGAKSCVDGVVYRELQLAPQSLSIVDEEKRIVEISFASEFPVERDAWWEAPWVEVLGCSEKECDLSRLNAGATLHYNHSRERADRLGAVTRAWVDPAGKAVRAQVQFSARADVEDVWGDVKALLLRNVSVGYFILERTLTRAAEIKGEPDEFRVTRWQPFEISFVDIPADPTVGLGRAAATHGFGEGVQLVSAGRGLETGKVYRVLPIPGSKEEGRNMKKQIRGKTLGGALEALVLAMVTDAMPRETVIAEAEAAAGLEAGALAPMLDGSSTECPTREVLDALAQALGGEVQSLVDAATADGCEYPAVGGEEEAANAAASGEGGEGGERGRTAANAGELDMKTIQEASRAEADRQKKIRGAFAPFRSRIDGELFERELEACLDDCAVTPEIAKARLLDAMGSRARPAGGEGVRLVGDARIAEAVRDVETALVLRGHLGTPTQLAEARKSGHGAAFMGHSLFELARFFLELGGVSTRGMDKMQIVGRALTTSDFPLLANSIQTKALLLGYDEAPETWKEWCRTGSLPDFKVAQRAGAGAFPSLEQVTEAGEYAFGAMVDYGETIQLGTYGKLLRVSRQMIINDDLRALTEIPRKAGRAAARLPGDLAYGVLTGNGALADGVALFHATHANLITGSDDGVPSIAQFSKIRVAMATQSDAGSNAVGLNIPVGFILSPIALQDSIATIIASEKDTDTAGSLKNNPLRNFAKPLADARLDADSAAKYYGIAGPGFDTVEVAFLDGVQTPTIEQQEEFTVDALTYKVRLDCGASAMDHRTMVRNDGG